MFTLLGRGHLELQVCGVHVGACVPRPMSLGGSTGPKRQVGLSLPALSRTWGGKCRTTVRSIQAQTPTPQKMGGWRELAQVRLETEAPMCPFMFNPYPSCALPFVKVSNND